MLHLIVQRTPLNRYIEKRRISLVLISGQWPQNSPDLNLVDYKVWVVMLQRVHECRMNSANDLKLRLIDVWNSLQQNVIAARACVHAAGQHFAHLLGVRVTYKSCGQIKYK